MNVLNWIQQEKKVADYHVITWHTSHFHHPLNRTDILGQVKSKPYDETPASASTGAQQQTEGIGLGLSDYAKSQYKAGGLGTDGLAIDGSKDAVNSKVTSTSRKSQGNQVTGPEAATVIQTILPTEVYSVVESARQSALKVQNRIKQSAVKLRDIYQKQSGQTAHTQKPKNASRKQPDKEQKGTRRVSKDEVLSMQAENHYLLDSYDKNGQYSTLGK